MRGATTTRIQGCGFQARQQIQPRFAQADIQETDIEDIVLQRLHRRFAVLRGADTVAGILQAKRNVRRIAVSSSISRIRAGVPGADVLVITGLLAVDRNAKCKA